MAVWLAWVSWNVFWRGTWVDFWCYLVRLIAVFDGGCCLWFMQTCEFAIGLIWVLLLYVRLMLLLVCVGCLWIVFAFKFGWVFWVYFVWFGLLYGLVLVLGVCVSNFAVGLVWCVCLSVCLVFGWFVAVCAGFVNSVGYVIIFQFSIRYLVYVNVVCCGFACRL